MSLSRFAIHRMLRRLLLLQVPLNYRTMQGPGYLYVLWPWLADSRPREARVRAASGFMNAHPVFGSLAAGALLRRLEEGDAEHRAEELAQWRETVSGPLGLAGDALIWDCWRPLVFSLGVLLTIIFPTPGAWVFIASAILLLYNVPLLALRIWGLQAGYAAGKDVLEKLSHPVLARWKVAAGVMAPAVAGGLVVAGLWRATDFRHVPMLQFAAALGCTWFGQRRRWPLPLSLLLALGMALGVAHV